MCGALLPAGVLADRVRPSPLMRTASGAGALLYGSLPWPGSLGALTIPHLVVVALLTGVADRRRPAPSEMSAVRSVVPPEQLSTALSQSQARQHVGALLGGPLGGVLYGVTRWLPFAFDAVSLRGVLAARSAVCAPTCRRPVATGPRRKPRQDVAEGIRFVLAGRTSARRGVRRRWPTCS